MWFDFLFKVTVLCSDIDSPAAGSQMILFLWLFVWWGWVGLERTGKQVDEGVGLILSVTLSRFVREYLRPPFFTLSASHTPSIAFALIQIADLCFSLFLTVLFLSPFFNPCSSPCLSLSLSRMGLISDRTNRLIVFCESHQGRQQRGGLFH